MGDSEQYRTNELLAQVTEALRETVGVLRGIEGMLDSLCETSARTEEAADHIAYMSHSLLWRLWQRHLNSWRMARGKIDMERALDLAMQANHADEENPGWRDWPT